MKKSLSLTSRRLYWLHPHFYNWMGGHKYIWEVITRLRDDYELDVILVTSGLSPAARQRFTEAGVPVITLFNWSTNNPFYWLLLPWFVTAEAWYLRYVKKIDPHAGFISSMFPAQALARQLSPNCVQLCYEPFAFFYDQEFMAGFSKPYQWFTALTKFLYQGWDASSLRAQKAVMTISQFNRAWIKRAYGVDSAVVYEGVDMEFFQPTALPKITQKYQGKKVIFHSTDYTPIKGTKFLIEALPLIVAQEPDLQVVISETLPNSPQKATIVARLKELGLTKYVEFAGFLPYAELPAYLTRAEVVIQPSINQSMNLTVKEAMACETAIITSPEGKEQTKDGQAGFLVDPHDTSRLAQRALECLHQASLRRRLGKAGRQIIIETFSWHSVTAKVYKVLTDHLYA